MFHFLVLLFRLFDWLSNLNRIVNTDVLYDRRGYKDNLTNSKKKTEKNTQDSMGFKPVTYAIRVQRCNQLSYEATITTGSIAHF